MFTNSQGSHAQRKSPKIRDIAVFILLVSVVSTQKHYEGKTISEVTGTDANSGPQVSNSKMKNSELYCMSSTAVRTELVWGRAQLNVTQTLKFIFAKAGMWSMDEVRGVSPGMQSWTGAAAEEWIPGYPISIHAVAYGYHSVAYGYHNRKQRLSPTISENTPSHLTHSITATRG